MGVENLTLRDVSRFKKESLAGTLRGDIATLISSGNHKGKIDLGDPYWFPVGSDGTDVEHPYFHYYLKNGKVLQDIRVGTRFGVFPKNEPKEATLEEIPFERYGTIFLLMTQAWVRYSLDPKKYNKPNNWDYF